MVTEERKAQRRAEVEGGRARKAKRLELSKVYNEALRNELARLRREADDFRAHQVVIAGGKKLQAIEQRRLRGLAYEEKLAEAATKVSMRAREAIAAEQFKPCSPTLGWITED
jgi:hypothetical protein